MPEIATPDRVLEYWFGRPAETAAEVVAQIKRWFQGGPEIDEEVNREFAATVDAALAGTLDAWADTPRGRLALILVLDQFTRSTFRGDPKTYQGDPKAQQLVLDAYERNMHVGMSYVEQLFLSTPLIHAESLELQRKQDELAAAMAPLAPPIYAIAVAAHAEQSAKYTSIIERFGRFPHRNAILGRTSTPEEEVFLKDWAANAAPSRLR